MNVSASTSLFTRRRSENLSFRAAPSRRASTRNGNSDLSASIAIASRRLPAVTTPLESRPCVLRAV